ncbi:MAG TPA: sigma-54 dependent transcriptional regulator [candidate division Zixibacteria bacterium]|nr:sigma-54 dependent transcriptional regulator [candidate division Zixibacteria bacterium]
MAGASTRAAAVHILYAEDDPLSGRLVQSIVEPEGYSVTVVGTGQGFLRALSDEKPDLLLIDLHLPDASGLDLLAKARLRLPESPVIVLTASSSVDDAVKALKGGATDYLTKPIDHQRLIVSLGNALKIRQQQQDLNSLRSEVREAYRLEHLIGSSAGMQKVRDLIRQAAPSDATVLIVGESGTGKELVAKALHYASSRSARPFVDVNCAALTETLIESELFGHERGAFTSAISRRRGKFEQAHGGSLFLDEIGDMPLPTQAKMLRVLQERSFQRVGGEDKINVDVRVICATNHNLEALVQKNAFRLDLYYRINMIVIDVPPLRERKEDIPELARHFLAVASRSGKHPARAISDAAIMALAQHDWPGNVRELQNAIERAVTICDEEEIQPTHLPPAVLRITKAPPPTGGGYTEGKGLIEAVEQFERAMILAALEKFDWNKTRAAVSLGVTRRILSYKMQNLGIDKAAQDS